MFLFSTPAQRRFARGLAAALIPTAIDYLAVYLQGAPVFGMFTPVVVAALLAADKALRERARERAAE